MYRYYNAHPKGLIVGDCVKRAITLAAQMDYMEVQRQLNRYKKVTGAATFNSDYNPHKYVENVLHARKLSFPAEKGKPRMTAREFSRTHPRGRYILNMAGHWSCCVDGDIYDTWDCSDKCVYTAYQITCPQEVSSVNHYTVKSRYDCTFILDILDVSNGTSRTANIGKSALPGYCQCLEDFGFVRAD